MKKFIITLLLTPLISFAQTVNLNLTLNNIIPVNFYLHNSASKALTVPAGKIWAIQPAASTGSAIIKTKPVGFSIGYNTYTDVSINSSTGISSYLTPGTMLYCAVGSTNEYLLYILEFNAPSTQTGILALNEIKYIDKKIELFPNPTNSKLTLNSEKDYKIEIYDMQGQMVMKASGNTIDLSNLSNSVYILKAYDNLDKTTSTYKVVKN